MPTPNEIRNLVEQDRFELMMRCPFYGRIVCSVELVVVSDPQVRLACTDYSRIFISGDAYSALPEEMRLAVLAHEVLHIALRHAFRIGDREKNRFEKAADIEVHYILTESFLDPYGIDGDEYGEWRDLSAEQIYELLPPSEDKTKAKSDHCSPSDTSEGSQQSGDEDEKKKSRSSKSKSSKKEKSDKNSSGNNSGDGNGSGDGDGDGGCPGSGSSDSSKQDVFSDFRPRFDPETEMNCIALSKNTLMDVQAFGTGAGAGKGIGISSSAFERLLEKLDKPRVGWQVLLRQFLRLCRSGSYSWMRPNRRFVSRGLYLPGRQSRSFSGIVALDTSPSTVKALPRFVSELTGLLKAFGKFDITILECANSILQVWSVSSNESMPVIEEHNFKSSFGTDFTPVFDYIRDHHLTPNVLIYFTDGEGPCQKTEPNYPVLWMLTNGGRAPVPWGQVIFYEES